MKKTRWFLPTWVRFSRFNTFIVRRNSRLPILPSLSFSNPKRRAFSYAKPMDKRTFTSTHRTSSDGFLCKAAFSLVFYRCRFIIKSLMLLNAVALIVSLTLVILLATACSSAKTPNISIPFLSSKPKTDSPIRGKRMEFSRFELDWDGMTPLASRPKEEARAKLLTSIESECPNYQVVNEGEKVEEKVPIEMNSQHNAKIYHNYYWIRYRCTGSG